MYLDEYGCSLILHYIYINKSDDTTHSSYFYSVTIYKYRIYENMSNMNESNRIEILG